MLISVIIVIVLLTVYLIGRMILSLRFNKDVWHLMDLTKKISDKSFSYAQLNGLPEPVQRYFKYALKEGQPYISYAKLLHEGQFKTGFDKDWTAIKGEQYFAIKNPGFIWKGKTSLFTAFDRYIEDKGSLRVFILSLYRVVDEKGESFNQAELLRWLAESVWFPTNLLPSDQLNWIAIDENTSKLTFNYKDLSLFYLVTFNAMGEITQLETKRYIDSNKMETWLGKLGDYKEINDINVPTCIEAIWRLEKGDFSYAKFKVTKLIYNEPKLF